MDFRVGTDRSGLNIIPSDLAIDANAVVLSISDDSFIQHGDSVSVSYSGSTLQNAAGNAAETLSDEPVDNNVLDTTAPSLASARTSADGNAISLIFTETLSASSTPALSDFSISVDGTAAAPTLIAISGNSVVLTPATASANGSNVSLSYTGTALQDLASTPNAAAALSNISVVNQVLDTTAPAFLSAESNTAGTLISLNYDESFLSTSQPLSSDFTITAADQSFTPASVTVDGSSVSLDLTNNPLTHGDSVTVSYSGTALRDDAGNASAALSSSNHQQHRRYHRSIPRLRFHQRRRQPSASSTTNSSTRASA